MLRSNVKPDAIILAVAKAAKARLDRRTWVELALLTDTRDQILRHPRLLRGLDWGDDDYYACIVEVIPKMPGESRSGHWADRASIKIRYPNFRTIEDFLDLADWLRKRWPDLHAELYGGPVPVDALQNAAAEHQRILAKHERINVDQSPNACQNPLIRPLRGAL